MNNMKAKLRKSGGFTLIEMLIVVAIIAILIAVSIPLVGNALEKSRDATDQANERAAKAEAMLYYMGTVTDAELTALGGYKPGAELTAIYDAPNGKLVAVTGSTVKGYGQCTGAATCYEKDIAGRTIATHVKKVIKVTVAANTGVVTMEWIDGAT